MYSNAQDKIQSLAIYRSVENGTTIFFFTFRIHYDFFLGLLV
jgi:hypothetical protein